MSEHAAPESTTVHPPWAACTGVLQVVDLDAAQHYWEVSPGVVLHGYAFNGQVPGPVIEAGVGDALLVTFTNRLSGPAMIHWPGLQVSTAGSSLRAADRVLPGGRMQYRLNLPDAGTFWYHAHLAEAPRLARGLYGGLVVRDPAQPGLDGERLLFFDDSRLSRPAQIAAATRSLGKLRERQSDALLVNGIREPKMQIPADHVERWRLVNVGARSLHLSLSGHRFRLIGPDTEPVADPQAVDEVLIAPADRLDLAVGPFAMGEDVVLEGLATDRSADAPRRHTLATIQVTPPDA